MPSVKRFFSSLPLGILFLLAASPAFAMSGEGCGGDCASCHAITLQEANTLLKDIAPVKAVNAAPVRGLFEVTIEQGGKTGYAYIDYGKKHIIAGSVYDIASQKQIGGAAKAAAAAPAAAPPEMRLDPATLKTGDAIVMGNPNGTRKLFVFTDPECPFCSKMHAELKKLAALEPDLLIYIKLYPLKMHPKAYDKARVIIGEKSLKLLEDSFAGKALPAPKGKDAKKPVDDNIKFAEAAGIRSTPTLVFADGRIIPGYRQAEEIRELLSKQ